MVTTHLTTSRSHSIPTVAGPAAAAIACTIALVAVTTLAAIAGTLDHALVPSTPPRPTLHPTLAAAAAILANNARVLALPYGLLILHLDAVRWGRLLGDALLAGVLAANAITVGLAIGRWQTRLVPYLPHLPLEWAAAGIATSVWVRTLATHRRDPAGGHAQAPGSHEHVIAAAITTLLLLTAAAAVEVLLTPHAA
jgi:hypothetical protein